MLELEIDQPAVLRALQRRKNLTVDHPMYRLEQQLVDSLLNRLGCMLIKPKRILNIGSRVSVTHARKVLSQYYPAAHIINYLVDIQQFGHQENGCQLPVEQDGADLIIWNVALFSMLDIKALMREIARILAPNGCLLFTTLGPDTLLELRDSFLDHHPRFYAFFDMHDIGDQLLEVRLKDPVMDMEKWVLQYRSFDALFDDLKTIGSTNPWKMRSRGLASRSAWEAMKQRYPRQHNIIPVTVELIYGHAFAGAFRSKVESLKSINIPVSVR